MKSILLLFVALFHFANSKENTANAQPLQKGDAILAFGDSLTFGYGTHPQYSYPAILSQLSKHSVVNEGINGDTSTDGLRRLPAILRESDAKLMILCFGANDILQEESREELQGNLTKMIMMAKKKKMQVVLIAVPDLTKRDLPNILLYREIADAQKIPYIDGLLKTILSNRSLNHDCVHPNAAGYKKMAEEIYQILRELQIL